jgi:hypothetical protein
MSKNEEPDLFADPEGPKTCGNCGAFHAAMRMHKGSSGYYCELKLGDVFETDAACSPTWWYPKHA